MMKSTGILFFIFSLLTTPLAYSKSGFDIGVYYFPGWKDNAIGGPYPKPWDKIKPYPERQPKLGWYREGDVKVMNHQLSWMADYGISYVVFDWIWGRDNKGYIEHALRAYLDSKNSKRVKFSILWANHTEYIFSKHQLTSLVKYWCDRFFIRDEYKKVDGKPVVFIFSAKVLNKNLRKLGMTPSEFFEYANTIAKQRGLAGINFIAGVYSNDPVVDYTKSSGYAGFSAYNFHGPATYRLKMNILNMAHSYEELDMSYRDQWRWMLKNSQGLYIVPLTSGWDKRPWGGSSDPDHDDSISTPAEFEEHLLAAKKVMLQHPKRTKKMAVICCWNEFGEGSFIEPAQKYGFGYLEKIRTVFLSEKK
jgi:hypothetical protein